MATSLTPEQLEHFRSLLLEERAAAEARIRDHADVIPTTVRQDDDLGDSSDDAVNLRERELALVENEADGELIRKIDHAQERIQEGTYGISESSGKPIPLERLEAVPWATTLSDEEPPEDD
jgi:RNA polymerase-binding protein DksA